MQTRADQDLPLPLIPSPEGDLQELQQAISSQQTQLLTETGTQPPPAHDFLKVPLFSAVCSVVKLQLLQSVLSCGISTGSLGSSAAHCLAFCLSPSHLISPPSGRCRLSQGCYPARHPDHFFFLNGNPRHLPPIRCYFSPYQ